jgi:hypothetical protein
MNLCASYAHAKMTQKATSKARSTPQAKLEAKLYILTSGDQPRSKRHSTTITTFLSPTT